MDGGRSLIVVPGKGFSRVGNPRADFWRIKRGEESRFLETVQVHLGKVTSGNRKECLEALKEIHRALMRKVHVSDKKMMRTGFILMRTKYIQH